MFDRWKAASENFPVFESREKKIEFVELLANGDLRSYLAMCRQVEGYPADKDLKTQYEWSKAHTKKRFRELGWDTDGLSDTDNGEDGQPEGAATAGRSGVVDSDDDVPLFPSQASRTPPTVKKPEASGASDSDSGGEPRRKRRHRPRRGAEIDKAIASVRAGAEKVQLIRPDEESGDLDRKLEELFNVCIEHPHVSSLELQVCENQHPLHADSEIETVSLWPGNSARCDGGSSLRRSCAPRARDAQQWPPARLLGSDGNHARRRGGTLAG